MRANDSTGNYSINASAILGEGRVKLSDSLRKYSLIFLALSLFG